MERLFGQLDPALGYIAYDGARMIDNDRRIPGGLACGNAPQAE
jgi:hypothetical protein